MSVEGDGSDGIEAENSTHSLPPAPKEKVDYYEVIGVERDADDETIRKAYKKKAIKLHPDKNLNDPQAQNKFQLLNEAFQVLTDPIKRIDHNKELQGGQVGWGYDQEAARERARNYQWNGANLFFNMGAGMADAQASKQSYIWELVKPAAMFWAGSVVIMALVEILLVVTAFEIGMPQACAVWASLLGGFLFIGLLISFKTDDWAFPAGSLCSIVCSVSLIVGLIGADLLVQAHAFKSRKMGGIDPGLMTIQHLGIYEFKAQTVVDGGR
eukprot:CAMPEP_0181301746 /NCGR_PEP_ID=MMETSP1101-20121128/7595_1 /TAXON_ID=46948 /ORGANISM="Rhodomonas abbreviata, Strain Caron Lab Isolate" /LENGTH=268 /DNA_ID=CAMNT_0023407085 /DNA_START=163 /DNA_END=966 /DNA_ORIENTATION=+